MTPLQPGQTIAGKYILEEPIGLGTLGPVWIARHSTLETARAIAFLSTDRAAVPEKRAQFEAKAKSFAPVKSPNVIEVHDYGVEGDTPFAVVDFFEGETLASRLTKQKRVSLGGAVPWVVQLGKGLESIHQAGAVHGDLRPENILLTDEGAGELAKIMLLGITHALPKPKGVTAPLEELPLYESPEQTQHPESIDLRSDLWSFGVIVFELLTGRVPFPAENAAEARMQITADPVPAPSRTNPDLGEEVDRFFERLLERDPERRFQSASAIVDAFVTLSGARLAASGNFALLVKTAENGKLLKEVGETQKDTAAAPEETAEETDEGPPHEDATVAPKPAEAPVEQGPWTPVHATKADPRTGVIVALLFLLVFVVGALIVVLVRLRPPPATPSATAPGDPNAAFNGDEEGPVFVPFITPGASPSASAHAPKLGGPWPRASGVASAAAAPSASAADSAAAPQTAPPPRPTSIFGF